MDAAHEPPAAEQAASGRTRADLIPLVDALIDAYVSWREECAAVMHAYDAWASGGREDSTLLFSAYVAALDREEHGAAVYRRLIEQITYIQADLRGPAACRDQASSSDARNAVPCSPRSIVQRIRW
jgi:hypothetical protein